MEFFDVGEKVAESDIIDIEISLGANLPFEYRTYLLAYNGGRITPSLFDCDGGKGSLVDRMYGIKRDDPYDLQLAIRTFKQLRRAMPDNVIPIGRDPFGNQICLSVRGSDYGRLYLWDHERESRSSSDHDLFRIADNFVAFIAHLHDAPVPLQFEARLRDAYANDDGDAVQQTIDDGWDVSSELGFTTLPALQATVLLRRVNIARVLIANLAPLGNALDVARKMNSVKFGGADYGEILNLLEVYASTKD